MEMHAGLAGPRHGQRPNSHHGEDGLLLAAAQSVEPKVPGAAASAAAGPVVDLTTRNYTIGNGLVDDGPGFRSSLYRLTKEDLRTLFDTSLAADNATTSLSA